MGTKYAVVQESNPTLMAGVGSYKFSKFHETIEEAQTEAERLARKDQYAYLVLQTIGYAHPVAPAIEFTKF